MEWIKTTFGELKAGDVFTHHDEAERARDVFNYGEISVCVFANVRPGHSMGFDRPVYRLVSPEREALEKIVELSHVEAPLTDQIRNMVAIAEAALEVKP